MMMAAILGIACGMVLSMPPGPLSISITRQAMEGRFLSGLMILIGAALMDIVYILVATFTSSAIVVALTDLVTGSKWFPLIFQVICVGVLIFLGLRYLNAEYCRQANTRSTELQRKSEKRALAKGHTSPFFLGIIIALTNLASPTFLPSMIAVVSYLHANGWLHRGPLNSVTFSVAFGLGTTLWFLIVLRVMLHLRKKLSDSFVTGIYRFAGGTFILFAAVIVYNVVTSTEWNGLL